MLPADGPSGPGVLAGSSCSGRWPTGDTGQYPVHLPHRGQVLPHLSLSSASSCPPGACVHSQADLRISGKPEALPVPRGSASSEGPGSAGVSECLSSSRTAGRTGLPHLPGPPAPVEAVLLLVFSQECPGRCWPRSL